MPNSKTQDYALYPSPNLSTERINRTPLDKIGCLMVCSSVPKVLWGEAMMTTSYVVNRKDSSPLDGKALEEM